MRVKALLRTWVLDEMQGFVRTDELALAAISGFAPTRARETRLEFARWCDCAGEVLAANGRHTEALGMHEKALEHYTDCHQVGDRSVLFSNARAVLPPSVPPARSRGHPPTDIASSFLSRLYVQCCVASFQQSPHAARRGGWLLTRGWLRAGPGNQGATEHCPDSESDREGASEQRGLPRRAAALSGGAQ